MERQQKNKFLLISRVLLPLLFYPAEVWRGGVRGGSASCREGGTVSRHAGCTLNSIIEMATSLVVFRGAEEMKGDGEEERRGGRGGDVWNTFFFFFCCACRVRRFVA